MSIKKGIRLNRQELAGLVESIEAGGGDASHLRVMLEALEPEVKRVPQRLEKEETLEQRLTRRIGHLFPSAIPVEEIFGYDYRFTLHELRNQCRELGISISGDKKELAAKLIAHKAAQMEEPIFLGEGI